ncbi:MAG: hypothetical protein E6K34_03035 [Gammaproteobacteria bacterium]|nr:MAG: hypothetical protein E6K34_03035 [Gammaproteobacteria bacterium]
MTRMAQLQERRRALLARCAEQRGEFAERLAALRPQSRTGAAGQHAARHPLAWIAVLGAVMLMRRTREVVSLLVFIRSAVGLVGRAAQLLRLIGARASRPGGTQP